MKSQLCPPGRDGTPRAGSRGHRKDHKIGPSNSGTPWYPRFWPWLAVTCVFAGALWPSELKSGWSCVMAQTCACVLRSV